MPRVLLPPQCSVGGCLEMARSREVVGVKFWQKIFWARVFATHQVEKTLFPLCAGPPRKDKQKIMKCRSQSDRCRVNSGLPFTAAPAPLLYTDRRTILERVEDRGGR